MFETSVVRARAQAAGGRLSVLTISVIAHSAVIVGAIASSVASVDFPIAAPDEYLDAPVFVRVQIPPPLGTPDGSARPEPRPPEPRAQVTPSEATAPPAVPETITPADLASPDTTASHEGSGPATGAQTGPLGVPWGDPHSIATDVQLPPAAPAAPERIYEIHEVKSPVLVHRVEPKYPAALQRIGMRATVVVRCVIDRNGRVRDPQIVVPAMDPFNDAVLASLAQWRYTPGSRNGQAVETYLTVTVTFQVTR